MRSLSRLGWIRLASPLAGGALLGVLALADGLWPDLRPGSAPPSPSMQAPAPAAAGFAALHSFGQCPEILHLGLEHQTRLLCYEAFEVLLSDVARVPVWSVQRLDASTLAQARAVVREDAFRAELQLLAGERAELSDDARSNFDREHLVPAADMPTVLSRVESFSLANMIPQVPVHHRGLWARIELAMRGHAQRAGTLYVWTGITALEERPAFVGGRALVPSHLFKVVFKPRSGGTAVWWSPNAARRRPTR
jgi:endonuclease G